MARSLAYALTVVLLLAGVGLRLHRLGATCFTHEESAILTGWGVTPARLESSRSDWLSVQADRLARSVGYDELALRLPGALASIAALATFWLLGGMAVGWPAATVASAGFAWSALQIGSARQVGTGPWETWITLLTAWAFCVALGGEGSRLRWLAFLAAAIVLGIVSPAAACLLSALVAASATALVIRPNRGAGVAAVAIALAGLAAAGWYWGGMVPGRTLLQAPLSWEQYVGLVDVLRVPVVYVVAPLVVVGIVSAKSRAHGGLIVWWLAAGIGLWLAARFAVRVSLPYAHAVEPAVWLLAGGGIAALGQRLRGGVGTGVIVVAALVVVGLEAPRALALLDRGAPDWRQIVGIVRENWRPGEAIVVLHDRESFVFYGPDLESRVEREPRPVRAIRAFDPVRRGWLVIPAAVHLYPGWGEVESWLQRQAAVDVSPEPATVNVLYVGKNGRDELLFRVGFFEIPAAALMQNSLMLDLLFGLETTSAVLWKVDQLALAPAPIVARNPSLLSAVSWLAEHHQGDRAASLAYRLASALPDWREARETLEAFSAQ